MRFDEMAMPVVGKRALVGRPTAADIVLILSLVVLTFSFNRLAGDLKKGSMIEVRTPSEEIVLPLDRDARYEVNGPLGPADLVVEGGEARLENAPCPLKICERMGPVDRAGETVLCLPNRISVRVTGGTGVDAVTR